jgi:hypothetical protein
MKKNHQFGMSSYRGQVSRFGTHLYGLETLKHQREAALSSLFSFSWAASAEIKNK